MQTLSVNYTTTHEIKGNEKYKFCGRKCFNSKTGKEIKMQYKNGSVVFYIDREFKTLNELRKMITKIKLSECPF